MPSTTLYPLKFQPILKRYLWGGRRLLTELGKPLGSGDDYAESWEVADHASGQSVIANGPLTGTTLHDLVESRPRDLFGRHVPQPRFPLIFKFLDCHQNLSVQVHPNDRAASKRVPPDLGKDEAWLILDARPGSRVYAGLKYGFDREAFEREARGGRIELCLHSFEPAAGDCVFLPAGTIHALGAGLLVAEIQQASDTTFRLHDWDRVGPDGRPRTLHLEEALEVIDYSAGSVRPTTAKPTARPEVSRLAACDKFVMDRWELTRPETLSGDNRFHIVSVLEGEVFVASEDLHPGYLATQTMPTTDEVFVLSLIRGQTTLLPAGLGPVTVAPRSRAVVLDIYLP
jgi:mannose-6-phosphate isomerase